MSENRPSLPKYAHWFQNNFRNFQNSKIKLKNDPLKSKNRKTASNHKMSENRPPPKYATDYKTTFGIFKTQKSN